MTQRFGGTGSILSARVLVVEDENIIAKDIQQTLEHLGYSVCGVVDSGDEAVRRALQDKPDLILMDVQLRGPIDGIEAADRIRGAIGLPIVFLTAFADEATLKRAQGIAPYGYVLKPFDDRDLQVAAMMALAKHKAFQELDQRVRDRTDDLLKTEARFKQMAAVAELGVFALGSHRLEPVLERAVCVIGETLGTDRSSVLEPTPDGTVFDVRARFGWPQGYVHVPAGTGSQSGFTLLSSEPVISDDYSKEKRFRVPDEYVAEGIQSGMTVVIHSPRDSKPYGVLSTHTLKRRSFTVHESAFLQAVANLIATTVVRVRAEGDRMKAERRAEEDRLHAAQAEEALRLRDEFLSIASHELKTPLTSLQLQLQSLAQEEDTLDEKAARKCHRAMRSMERLAGLVETLLDVSRIRTGRLELNRELVTLNELVDELVERSTDECRQAGCELRVVRPGNRIAGRWDRLRIEQVFTNLISNACKYGGNRPIEIQFGLVGDEAEIRVRDGGPGIDPKDVDRIFERFERAVSCRHYGGLGLGLYISRQIVESHGGTIRVESQQGHGSTFIVRLPAERAEAATSKEGTVH